MSNNINVDQAIIFANNVFVGGGEAHGGETNPTGGVMHGGAGVTNIVAGMTNMPYGGEMMYGGEAMCGGRIGGALANGGGDPE